MRVNKLTDLNKLYFNVKDKEGKWLIIMIKR